MLVIGKQKVIEVPHEPGTEVTIKALSWKKLKDAQRAQQTEGIEFMRAVGAELLQALRAGDADKVKSIEEAQEASITSYDRSTLLTKGLVSWTYKEQLSPESIEELDEKTASFLAEAIFYFSRGDTRKEAGED
jgi:hypothetical protein|tara:strand:+ start:308 stop:706 length:399 start_codon:yes stop_codon:yes gene_type:complete